MKSTRIKISVSQDGLLPQESVDVATIEFPFIPKKLLRALGFERVDNSTFVGVMPVFINLDDKEQEIEIELGVSMPEMRKKILELFQPILSEEPKEPEQPEQKTKKTRTAKSTKKTGKAASASSKKTKSTTKKSTGTAKSSKTSKISKTAKNTKETAKKKPATRKTTSKRTSSKKTKG